MEKDDSTPNVAKGKVLQIDEGQVRAHLSEIVRGSVEETLNALLQKAPTATPSGAKGRAVSQSMSPQRGRSHAADHARRSAATSVISPAGLDPSTDLIDGVANAPTDPDRRNLAELVSSQSFRSEIASRQATSRGRSSSGSWA